MDLRLKTAPDYQPVTTAEAKTECQIDFSDDDTLIANLIKSATQYCENYIDGSIQQQTWEVQFEIGEDEYYIPRGPVSSVTHVKRVYQDGTLSDVLTNGTDYYLKGMDDIWFEPVTTTFNTTGNTQIGWRIEFVAGWTSGSEPQAILDAILKTVRHFYDDNTSGEKKIPFDVMQMLSGYRKTPVI